MERLHHLLEEDRKAEKMYEEFRGVLSSYDCSSRYSVRWNCEHCKVSVCVFLPVCFSV